MTAFTLIDEQTAHQIDATIEGARVRAPAKALRDATGWEWKTEGLCRGEVCVPVRDREGFEDAAGIDLAAFAAALGRPLAVEAPAAVAALGTAAADRSAALADGIAPDFELPDLEGRMHALSDHRGKKVLLGAYAAW